MATYLIICLPFLLTLAVLVFYTRKLINWKVVLVALVVLLLLTIIFDSLIIYANIVNYDISKILGVFIGLAPLEDFSYTIFALFFVVCTWKILEVKFKI